MPRGGGGWAAGGASRCCWALRFIVGRAGGMVWGLPGGEGGRERERGRERKEVEREREGERKR